MVDESMASLTGKPRRDGTGWRTISWIAAGAGLLSMLMTLAQGLILLAGIPQGPFWTVLIVVTSPGLPVAAAGLVFGVIGLFSEYRWRSLVGVLGFVVTFATFVVLDIVVGGH